MDAPVAVFSNQPSASANLSETPGHKNFSFPLNVYSHVLRLDYGDFQYLHYGMFEPGQMDVIVAQENATKLLFSRLPPHPCSILEVGIGTGTTLSKLVQAGHIATGITPDESQILYAKSLHGDDLPAVCEKFEDFADGRTFDLIVFQESAQYIGTADLFRKASALLNESGEIIIMDEMSLRSGPPEDPGLPLLDDYLSLAVELGFDTVERLDLTALATPTNDYILDAVSRHRERLIMDLGMPAADIDGLLSSAQAYVRKYADGRYGYGLLRFKKKPPPKWLTDWAGPTDEAELLALFRRAFGYDMNPALWRWKYAGLDRSGALTRRDGRVVAFYGGIPRTIRLFGSQATAVQIGDVMVDPAERGVLTRRGPFFLAASHYLRHCVGIGKAFPLAFGFPSQRACRLGERLGIYAKVGEIMRIDWPALKAWPNPRLRTRPLDASKAATAEADWLWLEMAAALSRQIVGVRDFAYLRRRYLEHPTVSYRVLMVSSRISAKPFGIIVVRDEGEELELVDVVALPERLAALVKIVRRLACNLGKPKAYTWITVQHAGLFAGESGAVSPTGIVVPAFNWQQGMPPAEIDGHWWLTAGDTDFR